MTRSLHRWAPFRSLGLALFLVGCGARTGLLVPMPDAATQPDDQPVACTPVNDLCGAVEVCGNGSDDDCNGLVDDGCACEPGAIQPCFAGPPGRRNIGVCSDGMQNCGLRGTWGACEGGVVPHRDSVCDGADNLCTGCSHDEHCPVSCPGPNDVRVPNGAPFQDYALRGEAFFAGSARQWTWTIEGGPCDAVSRIPSFALHNPTSQDATFSPQLSGDYRVTLTVVTASNETLTCTFIVHVIAPGLRVEMCYPENTSRDLDLYLHRSGSTVSWFDQGPSAYSPSADVCSWKNCEAHLRNYVGLGTLDRANWGYANTPLAGCEHGPYGREWQTLGSCANPRLDLDNNLVEGIGVPENINLDNPHDGDTFRIMVQNFTGTLAHPLVNVYCGGHRVATYGAPPDILLHFEGDPGGLDFGAMWRVADVTTHVDASGNTVGCDSHAVHSAMDPSGYDVTEDDQSF